MPNPIPSTKSFTNFITSNEMIAVASSILVTPLILGSVASLGSNLPVIGNNVWAVLLIASFIVFGLSSMVPAGMLRSVVIGVAGGLFINFLITNPLTGRFFNRIAQRGQ